MGAENRMRPVPTRTASLGVLATPFALDKIADPEIHRAFSLVQRSLAALSAPATVAGTHPTLRDQIVSVKLVNGTNWINHPLARVPRFVYVAPLATGLTSWFWLQQSGDADRARINLQVVASQSFAALVRLE